MSNLERARVITLSLLGGDKPPSEAELRSAAENAVQVVRVQFPDSEIDVDKLVKELEAGLNVMVGDASTLTDDTSDHLPWLPERRSSTEWKFTRRYQRFLKERKRWALPTLQRSDDQTDRILELLEDPKRPGKWDRRGMVVGEVQSGKTSNYIELACKATDAGYKFIVVLTGTTNSLRSQTQLRFDEGFLGWDTRQNLALDASNRRVGVGTLLGEQLYRALSPTNAHEAGDFNRSAAQHFGVMLGGDPVVMVVKKNGSVLRNLTSWARSLRPDSAKGPIANVPVLVIDDEADFASVNTKRVIPGSDEDPTAINGHIRSLLTAFAQSAYIGYTATPFANIFINPDQDASDIGSDLFPRDFLINLPVPSNHVGPKKVFGLPDNPDDETGGVTPLPLFRRVNDNEEHIPSIHRSSLVVNELPPSLVRAIKAFILVCAARTARGQGKEDNSMLIHVTRFVNVQDQVAELVRLELRELQNRIRYGDGGSSRSILEELHALWRDDFVPSSCTVKELYPDLMLECEDVSWDAVRRRLTEASQKIQVKVINGAAKDALDYWDHPDGMSAIVIGGDKLSRGLTLEGLSVSYYLRASRMYDTLLQMGRWFGYRPGYVDLCRLYTTEELRDFYGHITLATEELRQEFDFMADRGMTPRDFGFKVRSHPAGLAITAANKMRNGTRMTVSYSQAISETIAFGRSSGVNKKNLQMYDNFIRSLGPPACEVSSNRIWKMISGENVAELLADLEVHHASHKVRGSYLARYIRSQNAVGGLVDWTVALISNKSGESAELGGYLVHPVQRARYLPDRTDADQVYRIRRLVSPEDEMLDLTDGQRKRALDETKARFHRHEQKSRHQREPQRPGGNEIRSMRDPSKGLLLLYPFDGTDEDGLPLVGFAASFPKAESDTPVNYVVNTVYWNQEDFDI